MATTTRNSSTMSSTDSSPLLHDALNAYLSPLLEKHAKGTLILYEDLMNSWEACMTVLNNSNSNDTIDIKKRLETLHASQLAAYNEAAKHDFTNYVETIQLPPMNKQQPAKEYLRDCVQHVDTHTTKPDWKNVDNLVWSKICKTILTKRIREMLFKQKKEEEERKEQAEEGEVEQGDEDQNHQHMGDEQESGEDEEQTTPQDEDGEDDEEEGAEEGEEAGGDDAAMADHTTEDKTASPAKPTKQQVAKKTPGIKKRLANLAASGKKTLTKKKLGANKGRKPGARARRGGRGGGNAAGK